MIISYLVFSSWSLKLLDLHTPKTGATDSPKQGMQEIHQTTRGYKIDLWIYKY